jgi:hypothetical protein
MRAAVVAAAAGLSLLAFLPLAGLGDWQVRTHGIDDVPRHIRLALIDDDVWPDLIYTAGDLVPVSSQIVAWRNEDGDDFARVWGVDVSTDPFGYAGNGQPLQLGDLNGDGHMDLVIGNALQEIWMGDGSGAFVANGAVIPGHGWADDLELGDFDGDGILDVCELNDEAFVYVDCFRGVGDGTFMHGYIDTAHVPVQHPAELTTGDLNGDGGDVPDGVVTSGEGVWTRAGSSDYEKLTDTPVVESAVGDFDGDGLDDIAATAPLLHQVQVWRSVGAGDFGPPREVTTGRRPTGIDAFDHDLDGDLDLAVTNSAGRSVSILDNNGLGGFTHGALIPVGSGPDDVYAADIDLDGDPDLAVANVGDRSISVLRNPLR